MHGDVRIEGSDNGQSYVEDQAHEARQRLEQIDVLQAKVQYMANEMALLARSVAGDAQAGRSDKRMAEKDEKIALLMAEGQTLSQAELNHLSIIKKLRAKLAVEEKRFLSARHETDEAQKVARALRDRIEQTELSLTENRAIAVEAERREQVIEDARAQIVAKTALITRLQRQLEEEAVDKKSGETLKLLEQVDSERSRNENLAKSLSAAEASKTLSADLQKQRMQEVQDAANREREQARMTEMDLRRELKVGFRIAISPR